MNISIIIASILIALAILFSGGIYTFESERGAVVLRQNRFTGNIDFCLVNNECRPLANIKKPEEKKKENFSSQHRLNRELTDEEVFGKSTPTDKKPDVGGK